MSVLDRDILLLCTISTRAVVKPRMSCRIFAVDAHVAFALRGEAVGDSLVYDRIMHSNSLTILHAGRMFVEVSGVGLSYANSCNARSILGLSLAGRVSVVL